MLRSRGWIFLLICYLVASVFATEEANNSWNKENVELELKKWLKGVKTSKDFSTEMRPATSASAAASAPASSCYVKDDVLVTFGDSDDSDDSQQNKKHHVKNMDDLHGSNPGRLIFKDKRKLKADNFMHGLASGLGSITLPSLDVDHHGHHASNASFLAGKFQNGCLNGLVKGYEYVPIDGVKGDPSYSDPLVDFIGIYKNGYPNSPIWKIIISPDGIVLGYFFIQDPQISTKPNLDIELEKQNNVIFLYPDLHHGIRGQFDNKGVLIAGHRGRVVAEKSSMPEGIKEILFEEEDGKMLKSDIATKTHLSSTPLTRDPYESTMVDVKKSNIKNAGQGVFLKKSVKANTTLAYFNGVRLPKSEVFTWNPFKKPTVYLVETSGNPGQEAEFLDILPECADWNVYRASTGHKINHSGKNYNQAYTECFHPIFGKILCSYSLKDLPEGTELLTHYEVALDKEGMKKMLKVALELGHRYTGRSRKDFAETVRPYLKFAAQMADQVDIDTLLSF